MTQEHAIDTMNNDGTTVRGDDAVIPAAGPAASAPEITRFEDLGLPEELLTAVNSLGFTSCTPIQEAILSRVIDGGDAAGQSQTGTGKTAAFLISIMTRLLRDETAEHQPGSPRALILAPTRELVCQIEKDALDLARFTSLTVASAYGGIASDQQRRQFINKRVDILVATPGRLLDFMRQKVIRLGRVRTLVIDEADRMLDMGFIPDIRTIVHNTPPKNDRQTLFFSATMTPEVLRLSEQWTNAPVRVNVESEQVTADSLEQIVYMVTVREKFTLLYNLIHQQDFTRAIIFCNRKDETNRLYTRLLEYNIHCTMLSGDVPQYKRMKRLEDFRAGKYSILVATDVAGRGIHVEGVSHVINFHLPEEPENYVHRIGRTARAGASGVSVSFADEREAFSLPDIEEYLDAPLPCIQPPVELLAALPPVARSMARPVKKSSGRNRSRRSRPSRTVSRAA
ncbi:MAG: DEAD/DEAH box helicase [Desulfobulbaceae bacterium]|jgi:ATP-dependent RNA helicase RhlB|nr:DEAD/DEAH box helicase [Desulfobulbaceae bacterium]